MPINTIHYLGQPAQSPGEGVNTLTPMQVAQASQMIQQQVHRQRADGMPAIPAAHPGADSYSSALLASALSGKPVSSTLEGVGRVAQLAAGYGGIISTDAENARRQTMTANEVSDAGEGVGSAAATAGGAVPVSPTGNAHKDRMLYAMMMSGDPALKHAAVQERMRRNHQSEEDARTKTKEAERLARYNKLAPMIQASKTREEFEAAVMQSGDPELIEKVLGAKAANLYKEKSTAEQERDRAIASGIDAGLYDKRKAGLIYEQKDADGNITLIDGTTGKAIGGVDGNAVAGGAATAEGGAKMPKTALTAVAKELPSALETRQRIGELKTFVRPEMFSYGSRGQAWLGAEVEKITGSEPGASTKKIIADQAEVNTRVNAIFNAMRKEITGAAAAQAELTQLQQDLINPKDSYTQFATKLAKLDEFNARNIAIKQYILNTGRTPTDEQLNQLWAATKGKTPEQLNAWAPAPKTESPAEGAMPSASAPPPSGPKPAHIDALIQGIKSGDQSVMREFDEAYGAGAAAKAIAAVQGTPRQGPPSDVQVPFGQ
jgi:hypothetical protein